MLCFPTARHPIKPGIDHVDFTQKGKYLEPRQKHVEDDERPQTEVRNLHSQSVVLHVHLVGRRLFVPVDMKVHNVTLASPQTYTHLHHPAQIAHRSLRELHKGVEAFVRPVVVDLSRAFVRPPLSTVCPVVVEFVVRPRSFGAVLIVLRVVSLAVWIVRCAQVGAVVKELHNVKLKGHTSIHGGLDRLRQEFLQRSTVRMSLGHKVNVNT